MNNKSIMDVIRERHSVRSYDDKDIPHEIKEMIEKYISEINDCRGIFNNKIRIEFIKNNSNKESLKLGTYGVIKGAKYYMVAICKEENYALEDLGYLFEKVILYCTALGLGTVWLGGTYNKSNFAKAVDLKDGEVIKIISPLGYEAERKSLIGKVLGISSKKRLPFKDIFFDSEFEKPLTIEKAGEFADVLEMVRLAPSALNKQPWRILKDNKSYHIYIDEKSEFSKIDVGIALCHFHLTAMEKELSGKFKKMNEISNRVNTEFKYIVTWISE